MKNITLCVLIISACLSACAPKLISRSDVPIQKLGVCVNYDMSVPEEMREGFEEHLLAFIDSYNSEAHSVYLYPCEDANQQSLRLHVANTKMVSSGQQVAGAVVSTIGLATPFAMVAAGAPFYIWFSYFPNNTSQVGLSLSNDISQTEDYYINRRLASWAFLVRPEKQVVKHTRKFEQFLGIVLLELERGQRKHRRKRSIVAEK